MIRDPFKGRSVFRIDRVVVLLLSSGVLSELSLSRGRRAAAESGSRLDRALSRLGLVSDDALVSAWSAATGLASVPRSAFPAAPPFAELLPPAFLRHARCAPLCVEGDALLLAVEDPLDVFTPRAVAARTGLRIELRLARSGDLDAWLKDLPEEGRAAEAQGGADEALTLDVERLRDLASDAPVVRLVNAVIDRAIEAGASDVHLTASRGGSRLRYRIDGVLQDMEPPAAGLHASAISRIKIMAGLDIAERRLPQDGRIRVSSRGQEIDLRVATMPHAHGEGAVLRVLDRSAVALRFEALGLSEAVVADLRRALSAPHGLILVTGPTGSGKTTTLYAALKEISGPDRNVVTVEDPVEHHLDGVNQIQVARKVGFDFASALRAVLRQDPDVVMVGEIRDRETASVAVQAALTGHLVLATVHTNTAAGALPRLVDMGVEPYLVASTVRGALAQRLVRRLCACAEEAGPDEASARAIGFELPEGARLKRAVGCPACNGTGYRGRLAISEFMTVTDRVRDRLLEAGDERALSEAARQDGMVELTRDGFSKVLGGDTTLDELVRVTGLA
ncbi:MAG: type II secretion system protein GspE [Ancylobacter novellus]|uniref:Type II secretion system protein GspE n=1 Tax=Ancylobacter novellus TaxID=921 RepID=A0A2W5MEQ8_ANCNO|nr:MAG: type II secretion system protein GspE [Ancylobacter novellus]